MRRLMNMAAAALAGLVLLAPLRAGADASVTVKVSGVTIEVIDLVPDDGVPPGELTVSPFITFTRIEMQVPGQPFHRATATYLGMEGGSQEASVGDAFARWDVTPGQLAEFELALRGPGTNTVSYGTFIDLVIPPYSAALVSGHAVSAYQLIPGSDMRDVRASTTLGDVNDAAAIIDQQEVGLIDKGLSLALPNMSGEPMSQTLNIWSYIQFRPVQPIPEPQAYLMFCLGLCALVLASKWRGGNGKGPPQRAPQHLACLT